MIFCQKNETRSSFTLIFVMFVHSLFCSYTDPGTGTMIWQLLLAVGFGMLFYMRRIFDWAKSLLIKDSKIKDSDLGE